MGTGLRRPAHRRRAPRRRSCSRRRPRRSRSLKVTGSDKHSKLHALRGVALTVADGESVALVGESGSGKSTLLRVIAGLHDATAGSHPTGRRSPSADGVPGRRRVADAVAVGRRADRRAPAQERLGCRDRTRDAVAEVLERVGLPAEVANAKAGSCPAASANGSRWPARRSCRREVLLCDEPTSALDVSLAATVLNLIGDLRRELDMSVVFVTHDLSVARVVADRIAVMYLGRIVEIGPAEQVTADPRHPYTQALVDAMPGGRRPPRRWRASPPARCPRRRGAPSTRAAPSRSTRAPTPRRPSSRSNRPPRPRPPSRPGEAPKRSGRSRTTWRASGRPRPTSSRCSMRRWSNRPTIEKRRPPRPSSPRRRLMAIVTPYLEPVGFTRRPQGRHVDLGRPTRRHRRPHRCSSGALLITSSRSSPRCFAPYDQR